jgi:glycosyltransferase involved in cell wall biosynthesis
VTTSIIIPVFNEEKYLSGCLSSLTNQTLRPDEIIICDNNSTDKSVAIAKSFQNILPIKIIHQPVKGIIPTVEKAWRVSTGEIIVRTDADALYPKDWLNNIINHFKRDTDLVACGGNWRSSDGNLFWKFSTVFALILADIYFPLFKGYKLLLGPNLAIRRSIMSDINGFLTTDPHITDDQLISLKLTQKHLKYKKFSDCWNYHSTRRFHGNPKAILITFLSAINPKYYQFKSS